MDDIDIDDHNDDDAKFKPSPREIAEACAAIQSQWTPEEHIKRRRVTPSRVADPGDAERIAREALEYSLARRRAGRA